MLSKKDEILTLNYLKMYKNEKNANDKIKKCIKNKNTFAL